MATTLDLPIAHITARPDRQKCFYSSTERNLINPFKSAYLAAEKASERKDIATHQIFPALFNHWEITDNLRFNEEEKKGRVQVCGSASAPALVDVSTPPTGLAAMDTE